jgi:hypothetical protein
VCACVYVCVCVLLLDLFQDDLRCLFSPHQVNHGGVQKPPPQVSLYKSQTHVCTRLSTQIWVCLYVVLIIDDVVLN